MLCTQWDRTYPGNHRWREFCWCLEGKTWRSIIMSQGRSCVRKTGKWQYPQGEQLYWRLGIWYTWPFFFTRPTFKSWHYGPTYRIKIYYRFTESTFLKPQYQGCVSFLRGWRTEIFMIIWKNFVKNPGYPSSVLLLQYVTSNFLFSY